MTFCVSHQKQLDNDAIGDSIVAKELVTNNDIKDDTRPRHLNGTENIILGKHETQFIDYLERIFGADLRFVCVRVR